MHKSSCPHTAAGEHSQIMPHHGSSARAHLGDLELSGAQLDNSKHGWRAVGRLWRIVKHHSVLRLRLSQSKRLRHSEIKQYGQTWLSSVPCGVVEARPRQHAAASASAARLGNERRWQCEVARERARTGTARDNTHAASQSGSQHGGDASLQPGCKKHVRRRRCGCAIKR